MVYKLKITNLFLSALNVKLDKIAISSLMLDSGLSYPGTNPSWFIVLSSWARHLTLTRPLHAGVEILSGPLGNYTNLTKFWDNYATDKSWVLQGG